MTEPQPVSLVISFRFLDMRFHGRADDGEPEWPPSPLRAFQALVAATAACNRGKPLPSTAIAALKWLETVSAARAPEIVAPSIEPHSPGFVLSVPNNALDLVGRAWARGNYSMSGDANPGTHRAMKPVRPTRFRVGDSVHYAWRLGRAPARDVVAHVEALSEVAHHAVALGWGVDMVIARARVLADEEWASLEGERWLASGWQNGLRVPVDGTFDGLEDRFRTFLNRVEGSVWRTPRALTQFEVIPYCRATEPPGQPFAAFALRDPREPSRYATFDSPREGYLVAARLRHAAHELACESRAGEWSEGAIAEFVLGHVDRGAPTQLAVGPRRFAYLPLPSIHMLPAGARVGRIRRVLVTAFAGGCETEVAWARRALSGHELVDEATVQPEALLEGADAVDPVLRQYLRDASAWATVTPVVLPGHDDHAQIRRRLRGARDGDDQRRALSKRASRVESLLRRALEHAGFSKELATNAELAWRPAGFWPGTDLASRYCVPQHLERSPRVHVRIVFRDKEGRPLRVPGPVCIGSGRFYGVGLFAAIPQRTEGT